MDFCLKLEEVEDDPFKKRFKYDLFPASSHHLFPKLIRNFFDRTERVVQPKIKLSN